MREGCNIGMNKRTCSDKKKDNYNSNLLDKSLSFSGFDPEF
jgi:hypothetical protein